MKLIKVVDTRDFFMGTDNRGEDKKIYIAGTGEKRQCAMCGRSHEIHAYIEMEDGTVSTVGVGCAKKDASLAHQIKIMNIQEQMDAIVFPSTWHIVRNMDKSKRYGERIWTVMLGETEIHIRGNTEKEVALWSATAYPAWKVPFQTYFRLQNRLK